MPAMHRETRGVSTVFGVALLFAVVIVGIVVVLTVGAAAIDQTRSGLDTARAEKAMTQFDSRSAMVALGGTSHQGIDLPAAGESSYGVDDDAGWMNVTIYNETSDDHVTLVNVTLGAFVYENVDDVIAYQGGGVWQRTDSGVRMLSPPEFHFRSATLTLPIITVDGSASIGGGAVVTKAEPTTVRYPNATDDPSFTNPLADGWVNVTVHSEYYEAWGAYFEQRTQGNVSYNHTAETVRAQLVVPFEEEFDNAVATNRPGGITMNGNDPPPDPHETGTNYPLLDDQIDDQIEECESVPTACDESTPFDNINDNGTYYTDADFSGDIEIDNPGGNVTVVVNGKFEPSSVEITSNYNTTVYVKNSETNGVVFATNALINDGGSPADLSVVVHSNVERVKGDGNYKFVGLLYAPGSDCQLDGGGSNSPNVVGGVVCEEADFEGDPNDFQYDSSINDTDLAFDDDFVPVTYLHVTTNPINVTSG